MINLIIYYLYIFIINSLIKILDIKSIIFIINTIFYDTDKSIYIISILIGILLKNIKKYRFKDIKKIILLLIIDTFKVFVIKYNLYLIIFAIIFSILIKKINIKANNISSKLFYIIILIILPLSTFLIVDKIKKDEKNIDKSFLLCYEILLMIICFIKNMNYNLFNITNILFLVPLFLISLYDFDLKTKKRNIVFIFLILSYLIYYVLLP